MTWLEAMRHVGVLEVAPALGLKASVKPRPGWLSPCPACQATTRHTKSHDRRGAVGVTRDGKGWRCFQCDAAGDALRLVEWVEAGAPMRELDAGGKAKVREWCEVFLGIEASAPRSSHSARCCASPAAEAAAPTQPGYPPAKEVACLWRACVAVSEHPATAKYLQSRGLDPLSVQDRDLARTLPDGVALPRWARFNGTAWPACGYRLIVPMVDPSGRLRTVLARSILGAQDRPKSVPPKGYARAGLIMAGPLARTVLECGRTPEWWSGPPLQLIVTEGEVDYLTAATDASDANEHAPGVLGIVSGSWTEQLVARLPSGTVLNLRTDPDDPGAKYAAKIINSCRQRHRRRELGVKLAPWFEAAWSPSGRATVQARGARRVA